MTPELMEAMTLTFGNPLHQKEAIMHLHQHLSGDPNKENQESNLSQEQHHQGHLLKLSKVLDQGVELAKAQWSQVP